MKIDAHQHFWHFDPVRDAWIDETMTAIRRDFLPQDLQPLLNQHGFTGCVAVQADQSEAETDFLLQLAEQYPFVQAVVGWIDLKANDLEARLEKYEASARLKGFRQILQSQPPEFMLDERFMAGVRTIGKKGYTYDILVFPHHLPSVLKFLQTLDSQPFVIDHLAKPYIKRGQIAGWESDIRAIAKFENVFCKVSGMVTEADWQHWQPNDFKPYLDVVFEAFGTNRLMYGSDWPVCLLAADYARQYAIVADYVAQYAAADADKIFGYNAAIFYKIN